MLNTPFARILSLYLIVALLALTLPTQGWAMIVPAGQAETRSADLAKVQATLESSVVRQRLLDYGLTAEETTKRLGALSDQQIHQFAAHLDAVQAGGDVLSDVIVILLIVVIVIAILELTGHHVVIRH
ncbi:MAG: PA2779 family protein [Nitrospirae bacterium]|nr:PA2779 family protein [Nitrospirota bacterium]NTW65049.1 PA2779 family protein [Nitrospirota bacterium]